MNAWLRTLFLAVTLCVAACSSTPASINPREMSWNTVWPTPPDHAYWGTWKSGSEHSWLQIDGSGEGFIFRDDGKEAQWIKTPLRVVKPTWGSGWGLLTEAGAKYRMESAGDGIAVSGPDGEQRYQRAALPEDVATATLFRQSEPGAVPPTFETDEESDWWWPF